MSKADRVRYFLDRIVYDAIAARALEYPEDATTLKRHAINLRNDISFRVSSRPYAMKELADIMAWKKAPRVRE